MKIVSIWNPKGGQAKSLIAVNLAAAACEIELKPLVICGDPQGTSMLFHQGGNLPFEVEEEMPKEKPDADLVIIDHSAGHWDVPPAPTVIMPTKPDRSDIATCQDALAVLRPTGKRVILVVTDGQGHRASHQRAIMGMRKAGAFELKSSGVYGRAAEEWRTIFDPKLNGAYKVRERRAEFEALLSGVLNMQAQEEMVA
ncbi:MAG: ParA family protein [Rhodobacteraceae bacterium]|nr:ParA family protein [Paracoccaceae bacterium]